jgi:DNA-binding NarL/FixJ family response regulator
VRELEVLGLLVLGRTDREIASALFVSVRTAQGHVAQILSKLGVGSRTAAVGAAIATGMVAIPGADG